MFQKLLISISLAALMALSASRTATAATVSNTSFPINLNILVPCANGGAGEVVALTGELHDSFRVAIDSDGLHLDIHDNPQGVSGTGLTTGEKYQATGVTRINLNFSAAIELTFVNNFRIIGQGPGNNFLFHDNLHITVDANGDVTAFHDNFRTECK